MDNLMNAAKNFDWVWEEGVTPFSLWHYPVTGSFVYLLGCTLLQRFMKNRAPYTLTAVQVVYNAAMVLLAFAMFVSIIFFAVVKANAQGAFSLICEREAEPLRGGLGFVMYIFYLSKYVELFDTVLLIVRKKPVIFLHRYHHVMMLTVTWSWLDGKWLAASWWCVLVNSLVHTFMYYYFLQASLNRNVWWKKYLTLGQIIQFFTGFALVNYWLYIRNAEGCRGGLFPAVFSHVINVSFIVLFILFYRDSYSRPKTAQNATQEKKDR